MVKNYIKILLAVLFATNVMGQDQWLNYKYAGSISGNDVFEITEDGNENKWVLTNGGVSMLDGTSWKTLISQKSEFNGINWQTSISLSPGIELVGDFDGNDSLRGLIADKQGKVWIYTKKYVMSYDGKTLLNYGQKIPNVTAMTFDTLGKIWVVSDFSLASFDGDTLTQIPSNNNLGTITAISADLNGNIWVGSSNQAKNIISKFDGQNWTSYDSVSLGNIISIKTDLKGIVWIGHGNGLVRYDGNSWFSAVSGEAVKTTAVAQGPWLEKGSFAYAFVNILGYKRLKTFADVGSSTDEGLDYDKPCKCEKFSSIYFDKKGRLWVGTIGGGLCESIDRYAGLEKTHATFTSLTVNNNVIRKIIFDAKGNKWIGTDNGVCKFDGKSWTTYNTPKALDMAFDSKGVLWIATYGSGLIKFDGNTLKTYNTSNSDIPTNYLLSIAIDTNDVKFIGSDGAGLLLFDHKGYSVDGFYSFNKSNFADCLSNYIYSVAIDKNQNKWLGHVNAGLSRFNEMGSNYGYLNFDSITSGLSSNTIRAITIDKDGNKWIGTQGGGLNMFDGTNWTTYNTSNSGIASNNIRTIAIDAQGKKWIATIDSGISVFDGSTWIKYNTSNSGLTSNKVKAISIDEYGTKWIGTIDSGLSVLLNCEGSSVKIYADGNSTNLCKGSKVSLYTQTMGTITNYEWYKNDTLIDPNYGSIEVTDVGNYSIKVTTDRGCKLSDSIVFTDSIINPIISVLGDTVVCADSDIEIHPTKYYGNGYSYEWYKNDTLVANNADYYSWNEFGTYVLKVKYGSVCIATSNSVTISKAAISVNAPNITSTSTTFCSGSSVVLSTKAMDGCKYEWYYYQGKIADAVDSSYSALNGGDYYLKVSDSICSALSNTITITENPNPETPNIFSEAKNNFCDGSKVNLYWQNGNIDQDHTVQWYKNDTLISGADSGSFVTRQPGKFVMKVSDQNACAAISNSVELNKIDNDLTPPSVSALGRTEICRGSEVDLKIVDLNLGKYSYYWATEEGINIPNYSDTVLKVKEAGTYYLELYDNDGCTAKSNSIVVGYIPGSVSKPIISEKELGPFSALFGCKGKTFILYTADGAGYSYKWYKNDTLISGAIDTKYSVDLAGIYNVMISDTFGCSAKSDAATVYLNTCAGVEELNAENVSVSPNPAYKYVQVDLNQMFMGGNLSLHTMDGSLIYSLTVNSIKETLDISGLSPGTYMIKLSRDSNFAVKKIIVQ